MELKEVRLYGGAITCQIPIKFEDLSKYIPVEDNQEVFVYYFNRNSEFNYGPSGHDFVLSFEILQYLDDSDDMNAGRRLFEDLSLCNESRNPEIHSYNVIPGVNLGLPELFNSILVLGSMDICRSKYNINKYTPIKVFIYNVRMPKFKCEFMVSYSYPSDSTMPHSDHEKAFEGIVRTLKIVDAKLFEGESSIKY